MSINNKVMVLLILVSQILALSIPVQLFFYFGYYWLFVVSMIIFCVVAVKLILSVKYTSIKLSSQKISVKEFELFKMIPARYLKVVTGEVFEFSLDNNETVISFHVQLPTRIKVISFSLKYFSQNQKSNLSNALTMHIYKQHQGVEI